MGGFDILNDLFTPGSRHTEDERNRLEWTRDEEGEGDPHHGPIDLSSGKVVMQAPQKREP
ncbi:DUF6191 domain-containing protein [Streptomyces sp. SL13]|uniref:DUF6191 domain-containing protein n=1 Tax=Streptantibioticus silvisoli TaxID=2705255 RepID=A0AA90H018_9ACTN|nr:DUF6191 domain-containing protein [Streptantibioticus silvisoli]MDI5969621.1 DUF6191 domain-containing protein [Streptantibioticus silvisoli]